MAAITMLLYGILLCLCIFVSSVGGVSPVLSSKSLGIREDEDRVKRSSECSDTAKLTAVPEHAGMYGGKLIDLSGPCFSTGQETYCKFTTPNDNKVLSNLNAIDVNKTHVRCLVPRLLVRDRVILSVSTDNGQTYPYSTNFTIVFPGRMSKSDFVTHKGLWFFPNASILNLEWENSWLSTDENSLVDIRLIGYKENDGKAMYSSKPLATLGKDVTASSGQYQFDVSDHQCEGQDCYNYEVGLVEVRLQDKFTLNKYKFLTTNRVPLGWFVRNAMTNKYGQDWPSSWCMDWYNKAKTDMGWFDEIPKCPCSLAQAMADFGRWQPDTGCNLRKPVSQKNCKYHHAAVHCVRSVQPVNGAGNQCCYSSKGYLVFAADTYFGSTADKGHDWGAAPYGMPLHVPILSHWVDDIIPLFTCCQWTDFKSCDYYVKLRGTTDCTEYSPPVPASVYGQGHIVTFGGKKFRILASGDYTLLKAGNTEVQARFENNLSLNKNDTFTLTSVAVVNNGVSDVVELRLDSSDLNKNLYNIEVLLNGNVKEFEVKSLKWQDFKGIAVINTAMKDMNANFTVLLTNNIGFQVSAVAGSLQLDLMMPTDTYKSTSGLFGNIDGKQILPDGMPFSIDVEKAGELYNNFERKWIVNTNNLFSDRKTFSNKAVLNPTELSVQDLQSVCAVSQGKVSEECDFDYKHTGSREVAEATKEASLRYKSLADNLKPIRSCGLLNVPMSSKSSYEYTIGTRTTITGCRTGSLTGTSTYTCEQTSDETQAWSPAVTAKCVTDMESSSSNSGMIIGIVIAVVVVVVASIIIIVVIVLYMRKRRNKNRKDGSKHTTDEMQPMSTEKH